ncbi:6-carboxytetrahydropterin synthase QueD [Anaeromicropila populeti]|uniref:6-carboxy-5,6,7,8-tetrahydropterin synthase n=1 Tax=Anaeromicropila populeti TaxID=37658 RepID=A0A1I6I684_9FIRM|nr:6-carboxytetrahydropterin synthase QueD [Anaeromicropila populeti]SFR62164.1 6-pyruvoyltetrahydropterin/6-carboxytetrahydropterin synthase [Anaeromicropila populeti]
MNDINIPKPKKLKYHEKRVAVTKEFDFSAAHFLYEYQGKCKNLHGHTYIVVLTVSGYTDEQGFLIDFNKLKSIYIESIHNKLDHSYLNSILTNMNSTVENMIVWIWEQLEETFSLVQYKKQDIRIEEIKLYETPTSYATLKWEWMHG